MDKSKVPQETPWGPPQDVENLGDGIFWIDTASHGGFWLAPETNKKVPLRIRRKTFCQNGLAGFYEEDEDAAIVKTLFNLDRR